MGYVSAGSPAEQAGIERGDVILEMDGQKLENSNQLRNRVSMTAPGTTVHFKLLRNGVEKAVAAKLTELPNQPAREGSTQRGGNNGSSSSLEGVAVQDLDSRIAQQFQLPASTKGVVVTEIAQGSRAAVAESSRRSG